MGFVIVVICCFHLQNQRITNLEALREETSIERPGTEFQPKEDKMLYQEEYDQFLKIEDYHERYATSFPIAVFGTLRKLPRDQGNLHRMLTREPIDHRKAFIPHMMPSGIWVEFAEEASGIFEVFFYDKKDFPAVIRSVDSLEGFTPDNKYGYWRTLLKAYLLPRDYDEELFNRGIRWDNRTLGIPQEEWDNFEVVPVWAYSNSPTNNELSEVENSPLLWWH